MQASDENSRVLKTKELFEYYEKKMASYSSVAKYGVAILSALIVVFPSTYTFIKPPYNLDFLLLIAFVFAILSFVFNCYVILLVEFRKDSDPRKTHSFCTISAFLTMLTLSFVFGYIAINVSLDRLSPPRISAIQVKPLIIHPGYIVELTGKARDDDVDDLKWKWKIINENTSAKPELIPSTLGTVYWKAGSAGKYSIEAVVMDDRNDSEKEKVVIEVRPK